MIKVQQVDKTFDGFPALTGLDVNVRKGSIYGLVGTNGAGKTTLIKHVTGVLRQDRGSITVEGEPVFENRALKARFGYVPDDLYFFNSYNLSESARFYRSLYPQWSEDRYRQMVKRFGLSEKRKLSKFSKGMQKQAAFILAMAGMPDYLVLDEPIDGLDPLIRKLVWKTIVEDVAEREMTVLVSSHNLREMEGICDSIGILHKGRMKIERDLDELRSDIHKVQVAFPEPQPDPYAGLNVLHRETRGSVDLLIVRDRRDRVEAVIGRSGPVVFDLLPLSLEEIFIYELGGEDDAIQGILF